MNSASYKYTVADSRDGTIREINVDVFKKLIEDSNLTGSCYLNWEAREIRSVHYTSNGAQIELEK